MKWSACYPNINPTEHVWDALGRRVAGRQPPPQTIQELGRALLKEWDRIPQLVINSLIDPMPQRASWAKDERRSRAELNDTNLQSIGPAKNRDNHDLNKFKHPRSGTTGPTTWEVQQTAPEDKLHRM
ncbi:transposable element Tcb2 transposase [Trichonephila clavipes]|nr:transposable element Tcb2 transposase [Trichonephila clavipes]